MMNNTNKYEMLALKIGTVINIFCAITGLVFFFITKSMSILLDTLISIILCVSTVISIFVSNFISNPKSKNYPFGKFAIENIFLLFRSILMLGTISFTIFSGLTTIIDFINGNLISDYNATNISLTLYGILMTSLCFLITITYSYLNNKSKVKSEIIRIEIKASLYDGLVTIVAISSLLIFSNLKFLESIKDIGDSITVICLSLFYLITPIKELSNQIKILIDKRRDIDIEKSLIKELKAAFNDYLFNDLYFAYTGEFYQIYICLFPKEKKNSEEILGRFSEIRTWLMNKYECCKVYLILSKEMMHNQ